MSSIAQEGPIRRFNMSELLTYKHRALICAGRPTSLLRGCNPDNRERASIKVLPIRPVRSVELVERENERARGFACRAGTFHLRVADPSLLAVPSSKAES